MMSVTKGVGLSIKGFPLVRGLAGLFGITHPRQTIEHKLGHGSVVAFPSLAKMIHVAALEDVDER